VPVGLPQLPSAPRRKSALASFLFYVSSDLPFLSRSSMRQDTGWRFIPVPSMEGRTSITTSGRVLVPTSVRRHS